VTRRRSAGSDDAKRSPPRLPSGLRVPSSRLSPEISLRRGLQIVSIAQHVAPTRHISTGRPAAAPALYSRVRRPDIQGAHQPSFTRCRVKATCRLSLCRMPKVCFVISPIGEDGSQIRRDADDLYDLVIKVALEPFDFDVVRADKLPGSGQITSEIIQLVQTAELCIIDLTGPNANVYYECGRRHETGKPFVQLIRKGDRLPFDLAGIRTIGYSLDTPRTAREAVDELRRFTAEFERTGYGHSQSGASLSTLVTALERVERKVDRLGVGGAPSLIESPSNPNDLPIARFLENPRDALADALASGQVGPALRAFQQVYELLGPSTELLAPGALLAHAGREEAVVALEEILRSHIGSLDLEQARFGFSAWCRYYVLTDREREALVRAKEIVEALLEAQDWKDADRAFFRNQFQRLLYGAGEYERALTEIQTVLKLDGGHPSYWYNASLIYGELGQMDQAEEAIDRCLALSPNKQDDDHLSRAIEVYVARDRISEARQLYSVLEGTAAARAALLMLDPKLREHLSDARLD
jgi:hypothetical protein